jgi:hypothetical protein
LHNFISFFDVIWINPIFFGLICLICLVNNFVFQVLFDNKVNLVITSVPSNLPISHVFESVSLIPPWNKRVDNFMRSTMFFANKFLSKKRAVIIMHVDDPWVLKEIRSLLDSYQLKVRMKWFIVNSSPQMSSEDPSSQVPKISLFAYEVDLHSLKFRIDLNSFFSCRPL